MQHYLPPTLAYDNLASGPDLPEQSLASVQVTLSSAYALLRPTQVLIPLFRTSLPRPSSFTAAWQLPLHATKPSSALLLLFRRSPL